MDFSPEWVLGQFWDFLIPKMTWSILYKGGEGESFGKWLLPENGFSWEIYILNPKSFRFGIILEKLLLQRSDFLISYTIRFVIARGKR